MKDMTKHFHESNDPEFDAQSQIAWEYLCKQKKLNHSVIQKVQKIITLKQTDLQPWWRGYYRSVSNQRVWVGGREGVAPADVPIQMNLWLASFAKSLSPKDSHIQFEKIHPFVDGNGRTGRMLMWWLEIQQGSEPTLILDREKRDYYAWFR
jgi:hypothetical protein